MKKDFFKSRLAGKSTAAVVIFCLAAVAALGIFSYNRSADELKAELSGISRENDEQAPVTEAAHEANVTAQNVPAEYETPLVSEPQIQADATAEVPYTEANLPVEDILLEDNVFGEQEPVPYKPSSAPAGTGAVVTPVSGEILNTYSCGELVKSRTLNVWKTHDGIDVAADLGTDVRSVSSGKVTRIERDTMMGVTVIIDHGNGYEGHYCNLAPELDVSEGDEVDAGTVIGEVGNTAESEIAEENHLHFGLMKNGSWTDPAEYLSGEGS